MFSGRNTMDSKRKFQYVSRAEIMTQENIAIWENLSIAVAVVDGAGVCVYMNRIQREMDGFANIDAVGKHITELYLPNKMLRIPTLECLRLGEPILRKAYVYRTIDNLLFNSVADFFPLFDQGKKDGVLAFCTWTDNTDSSTNISRLPAPSHFVAENNTRYTFERIVGRNPVLQEVVNDARAAAKNSANVMIWGESGTGKELFAQAIHAASPRRKYPFVPVNCAAIPESLLEGVLFGTVKGVYTDAVDAPGLFEKANGGTILLDELNSMPLGLQTKLLRVLQEKKIRRVGSQTEKNVDVRVISILNEPPLLAVEHGILRLDLYYRLAIMGLSIPPLRERMEDIPLLISSFLKHVAPSVQVSATVMKMFWDWSWPGNIRELLHVIEGSIVLLGEKTVIEQDCLPKQFCEAFYAKKKTFQDIMIPSTSELFGIYDYHNVKRNSVVKLKDQIKAFEARCICNVLRVTGGNVAKAARIMDLTGPGLRYKIKQLGIGEDH